MKIGLFFSKFLGVLRNIDSKLEFFVIIASITHSVMEKLKPTGHEPTQKEDDESP